MLLPQTKEREYRFKLALRIGLPIFALFVAFIFQTLITSSQTLQTSFFVEATLLIGVSIYFIFYLIYNGFSVKITDDTTKTFAANYLKSYLKNEIKKRQNYTLILVSVSNLNDINRLYGLQNGDRVLREVVNWIEEYFQTHNIEKFPIGHLKAGDFIIGLDGLEAHYSTVFELMCLKSSDFKVDDIEVKIAGAMTDTSYSHEIDYLYENLFENLQKNRKLKDSSNQTDPNELESLVIHAIAKDDLIIMMQNVYENKSVIFSECFVKLKASNGKIIYPKSYLKIINKLGLGVDFDLLVLETILTQCEAQHTIAINILPTSLRNDKFQARVKELMRESKTKIMFVLFEMEYYSFVAKYKNIIKTLREYGVIFAIDRVGSIHSSFLYLRELPIDVIRYDTYYSKEERLEQNRSIIDGFNLMVHERGIKSWIKNVEDEKTYNLANEIGIDYIQGKYLCNLEEIKEKN